MKKLLILIAAILLLLTGCGGEAAETVPTTVPEETVDPGAYVPGSDVEAQTGGAVYQYALTGQAYWDVDVLGDRLLLFSGADKNTVEVLTGEKGQRSAAAQLPLDLMEAGCQTVSSGIAYYDKSRNAAVYLDGELQEYHSVPLPENMQGRPAFSQDGTEIFYCVEQELRGMDTQREISRLIKSQSGQLQGLTMSAFDGRLVLSVTQPQEGVLERCYVSTENGTTLSTDPGIETIDTFEDRYLVKRMDGVTRQYIFGIEGQTPMLLNAGESRVEEALALNGALGITVTEEGLSLAFYELTEGKKTAYVTIPGGKAPVAVCADGRTKCIWVLTEGNVLYRWQPEKSAVAEETVYAGTVFTREAPDTEGLKALQSRVDSLNKQHGTAIRIWNDGVKITGGHTLVAEYQTSAITKTLDALEAVLGKFPENFLYKSVNSKLRICIVRSVDGIAGAIRFLDDADTFILLSCGVDVEKEFISAMGYVVDIHSLGNSPMLDDWSKLNPEGFAYGANNDAALTQGENRAFADTESMTAVSEERARLFVYAMAPGNEELFKSTVMQEKLLLMCRAIRDAWRLERKTDTYLWEQYLTESIAYQK